MGSPDDPPETRRDAVTETLHGVEIVDPYRWLEDPDDEAVHAWVDAQNEYAAGHLDTPNRHRVEPWLEELAEVTTFGSITVREGTYFRTIEHASDDHPILYASEDPTSRGRELVDPNAWPANQADDQPPESMNWYIPSWDGSLVAYGVTTGGDEQYDVHVISVPDANEITVLRGLGRTGPGGFSWDADDGGFRYMTTGDPDAGEQLDKEVHRYRLGGEDEGIFRHDERTVWPGVGTDPDTGLELVALSEMSGGTDWYVQLDGRMRPVLTGMDDTVSLAIQNDTVFIRTDADAPRGRLLACSVDRFREGHLSLDECTTILPEREAVLQGVVTTPDHLVVHDRVDACSRLLVLDHGGEQLDTLPVPEFGSVAGLTGNRDADEVFYGVESFNRPTTMYRVEPATGDRTQVFQVDVDVPTELTVEQTFVTSADGTEVPLFLCHRADLELNGDAPTVLYGYGGFRITLTPNFGRFRIPFLANGGVYAQVCARGGLEYGEEWHEAAMFGEKQHTFDDFIAAAEYLTANGYTNPAHLAVSGGSNGGLSVGAVVTQRPDLWGAALCSVPLLDMVRFHRFLLGESWTTEYGHPDDRDDFEHLYGYSPYHHVDRDEAYPPIQFRTATADTRVHPAHAWKMVARLQAETSGGPFLVRTRADTGHGVGKPTWMVVEEQAEQWTFLADALGMTIDDRAGDAAR